MRLRGWWLSLSTVIAGHRRGRLDGDALDVMRMIPRA